MKVVGFMRFSFLPQNCFSSDHCLVIVSLNKGRIPGCPLCTEFPVLHGQSRVFDRPKMTHALEIDMTWDRKLQFAVVTVGWTCDPVCFPFFLPERGWGMLNVNFCIAESQTLLCVRHFAAGHVTGLNLLISKCFVEYWCSWICDLPVVFTIKHFVSWLLCEGCHQVTGWQHTLCQELAICQEDHMWWRTCLSLNLAT